MKEERLTNKRLNWDCISKPLEELSTYSVGIHKPTIDEYKMTFKVGKKVKFVYDWWYSAVLKDLDENLYFLILVFHPKWSFYRIVRIDIGDAEANLWSEPKSTIVDKYFRERMGYIEREGAIQIWTQETRKSQSSEKSFARSKIKVGQSLLTIKKDNVRASLTFKSIGLPFWINKGREATCSPRGDTMSGFYDICQVKGSIIQGSSKIELNGVGINEHLMSFTPPTRFWERVDGIFLCTDQLYCAFIYMKNKVGTKQYEYKDGAVYIRITDEYLIPLDFKIEYLELDHLRKLPIRIRISADTAKGELTIVAQAAAEIEKQLALKIVDGQFAFKDGRKLTLTNGYGQHALH